ncbi:hypothetical protein [Kurthia sibirica]|uniref:Uncharacterized protein n=1 Tax=Kurthia sibirica TaxID=202750 RepID=A0A2U3AP79_9BACL|nr:hypothetical protein [Kurthia sibirica]PWI26309.1 hypothetical protein DEX24_02950 [Kurthia sibirica]GEK35022.1 hypothetical protein KSI01_25550 [Kurthia sibirica]
MKILYNLAFIGIAAYILIYNVNWSQPDFFDWTIIICASFFLLLLIINAFVSLILAKRGIK